MSRAAMVFFVFELKFLNTGQIGIFCNFSTYLFGHLPPVAVTISRTPGPRNIWVFLFADVL